MLEYRCKIKHKGLLLDCMDLNIGDNCRDGFLSPTEVNSGLSTWGLNLQPDMFSQFVEVNFLYSDRDQDGLLSLAEWIQLFKLMSEV